MIVHYFFLDYKSNRIGDVLLVVFDIKKREKKFIAEEAARAIRLVFFCYSYFFYVFKYEIC